MPIAPLFLPLNAVNAAFFQLHAAVFPIKGRICFGSLPLTSRFFRYNFVSAAIYLDQRR